MVVTDNTGLTDNSEVTVFIRENNPPTVNIQYGFTFTETLFEGFPDPVIINVNNEFYTNDPDGDALTYEWAIISPAARAEVIYAGSDAITILDLGEPPSDACPITLQLTATDPYSASASATTTLSFAPQTTCE